MVVVRREPLVKFFPDHIRTHPWDDCCNGQGSYYDFKLRPELIPNVLEDFKPFENWLAVQSFYRLLEWLNGPKSNLETNDCAFKGPHPNKHSPHFAQEFLCSFRLMFFQRHQICNVREKRVRWFANQVQQHLLNAESDNSLPPAHCVEVALRETAFLSLRYLTDREKVGWEVDLTGWVFGDTEEETMTTLDTVIKGLDQGLRAVSKAIE